MSDLEEHTDKINIEIMDISKNNIDSSNIDTSHNKILQQLPKKINNKIKHILNKDVICDASVNNIKDSEILHQKTK